MSLTCRSPPRSASTMRRRVGSARVSKASSCMTMHIHHGAYMSSARGLPKLRDHGARLRELLLAARVEQLARQLAARGDGVGDEAAAALGEDGERDTRVLVARFAGDEAALGERAQHPGHARRRDA